MIQMLLGLAVIVLVLSFFAFLGAMAVVRPDPWLVRFTSRSFMEPLFGVLLAGIYLNGKRQEANLAWVPQFSLFSVSPW